jgi:hypothetical protein
MPCTVNHRCELIARNKISVHNRCLREKVRSHLGIPCPYIVGTIVRRPLEEIPILKDMLSEVTPPDVRFTV